MEIFDRNCERELLLADHGLPRILGRSFEDARAERCLTANATSDFGTMVRAALCGIDDMAQILLTRAHDWLEVAIAARERPRWDYTRHWSEAQRLHVFGLCRWLIDRKLERELFSAACDHWARYFRREPSDTGVGYHLPSFVLAGRFEELLTHFDACPALRPPPRLKGIQHPGKVAYLFATHVRTGKPSRVELRTAMRSFLKSYLPVCLFLRPGGYGIPEHIPTWTVLDEITFGGASADGPENIRRALAYIPTDPDP